MQRADRRTTEREEKSTLYEQAHQAPATTFVAF